MTGGSEDPAGSGGAGVGRVQAPRWLRDLGAMAWLLVGVLLVVVGGVWIASLAHTIVMPVVAASVVAAVASPVIAWLVARRVPRGIGAALMLLAFAGLAVLVTFAVVRGITSQSAELSTVLAGAKDSVEGWLRDLGVDPESAKNAQQDASATATTSVDTLLHGVAKGVAGLSSLVFFLALTLLSVFFLLKDGPQIRGWAERHLGLPRPTAHAITGRLLQSLRGYFFGVTIVAAFNALVVGAGALALGVSKAGTIAGVTFLGAYVPYLGAWGAGAFAVLITLGDAGTGAALAMVVIQLLANGILQQLVQPIAYGAALGIHPLAVLIVTIGGGCLFGAAGLILAAPVTSAAVRISADVSAARGTSAGGGTGPPGSAEPAATTA
jgi:putative heme transporter